MLRVRHGRTLEPQSFEGVTGARRRPWLLEAEVSDLTLRWVAHNPKASQRGLIGDQRAALVPCLGTGHKRRLACVSGQDVALLQGVTDQERHAGYLSYATVGVPHSTAPETGDAT